MLLQSIKGSPYYKTFGDRAVVWENKLADLDEILNNLNVAQRKWVYLEPYQEQMKFKKPAQTGVNYLQCSVVLCTVKMQKNCHLPLGVFSNIKVEHHYRRFK